MRRFFRKLLDPICAVDEWPNWVASLLIALGHTIWILSLLYVSYSFADMAENHRCQCPTPTEKRE